jgi:hypothetical protein
MNARWGDWDPRSGSDPPGGWTEYTDDPAFAAHLAACDCHGWQEDHIGEPRRPEKEHVIDPERVLILSLRKATDEKNWLVVAELARALSTGHGATAEA